MEKMFSIEEVQISHTDKVTETTNPEPTTLKQAVEQIRTGYYFGKDLRQKCKQTAQEYREHGKSDNYKKQKNQLPAYYFGCVCSGKNGKYIHGATGLLIADFDHFGTPENPESIEHYRALLEADKYTALLFQSPSRQGLKVVIKIGIDTRREPQPITREGSEQDEAYKGYYSALVDYYKGLGISMDESGKNINRACFFSWDCNIYVNENSEVWETVKAEPTPTPKPRPIQAQNKGEAHTDYYYSIANFEEFINEMRLQGVQICNDHDNWIKVGFALADEFDDTTGGYYFELISQINDNYKSPADVQKQWAHCVSANDGRTGIEFIFSEAKKQGLKVPECAKQSRPIATAKQTPRAKTTVTSHEARADGQTYQEFEIDEKNHVKTADNYICAKYDIRLNVVSRKTEYKEKTAKEWEQLTDYVVSNEWRTLRAVYGCKVSRAETETLFQAHAGQTEYNPLVEFVAGLPEFDTKAGNSPIEDYFSLLGELTADQMRIAKKWFCQLVAMVTDLNFNPQLCLVLQGGQGIRKTEFLRHILPEHLRKRYFGENIQMNHEKDRLEILLTKWLIQIDEFERIPRNEEKNAVFKELITHNRFIDFRAVKQTYHIEGTRWAVFCASTNQICIYEDTQNRRFFTLKVNSDVDIDKVKKFDVLPMYAEAKAILKDNPKFAYTERTAERNEDNMLSDWNRANREQSTEEIYFNDYFTLIPDSDTDETARFILCAKEITNYIEKREFERTTQQGTPGRYAGIKAGMMGKYLNKENNKAKTYTPKKTTRANNTTYYIVYAHAKEVNNLLEWARSTHYSTENTTVKPYYIDRERNEYSKWLADRRAEQEKRESEGRTIDLFKQQPEATPNGKGDEFTPETVKDMYGRPQPTDDEVNRLIDVNGGLI